MIPLAESIAMVRRLEPMRVSGSVRALRGLTLVVDQLPLTVGSLVSVRTGAGAKPGEIVGFDSGRALVMLLGSTEGVRPGDRVAGEQASPTIAVGHGLLGRVIDGLGRPIDGGPMPRGLRHVPLHPPPVPALRRRRIDRLLTTGVRAIDLMASVGRGQRMGIFSGPGIGKSTLLGMVARRTSADVNVIALIGERGREVREFIEDALGPEGLARSVVIVSTSDESPLLRVRAAMAACSAAEFFRDQGMDALLMVDSITRLAHAQRQIGLSVGEQPATKGYTPSVFALLPSLLERAGAVHDPSGAAGGSITAFYAILVEGDDLTEPVSDAARGILDGHVVLTRALANRGHYPAIDVLDSVSRLASHVCDEEHMKARATVLRLIAAHRDAEDLIQIGAYTAGQSAMVDAAVALKPRIDALLRQGVEEAEAFVSARTRLVEIAREADRLLARPAKSGHR